MAQKVEFTDNGLRVGLDSVQVDCKVNTFKHIVLIEKNRHPDQLKISTAFDKIYRFYYMGGDSLFMENCGLIKDIFIAVDIKTDNIISVFIFFIDKTIVPNLITEIDHTYNAPVLKSQSAVSGVATNSKIMWDKNGITALLTLHGTSKFLNLRISGKYDMDRISPTVFYH